MSLIKDEYNLGWVVAGWVWSGMDLIWDECDLGWIWLGMSLIWDEYDLGWVWSGMNMTWDELWRDEFDLGWVWSGMSLIRDEYNLGWVVAIPYNHYDAWVSDRHRGGGHVNKCHFYCHWKWFSIQMFAWKVNFCLYFQLMFWRYNSLLHEWI